MSLISGAEGVSTDRQDSLLCPNLRQVSTETASSELSYPCPCRCIKLSIVHDVAEGEPSHS